MCNYPLVSIGVGSYNNAKYIKDTLSSVMKQSYPMIELIIVDDCSKDNSIEIIEEWIGTNDYKCKLIRNSTNLGVSKVCNILLDNATGKYFSFLGSDDIYFCNKVKDQVRLLESSEFDVAAVYSDVYLINSEGSRLAGTLIKNFNSGLTNLPNGYLFERLALGNFIPAMSVLCKRDYLLKVGGYDESLAYEDYDMWLKLSLKYKIISSNYISGEYRIHSQSLWSKGGLNMQLTNIKIMLKYLGYDTNVDAVYKSRLANEIEDVYINHGRKYLNLLFINFKINRNFKSLIFYIAGLLNIKFSALFKISNIVKFRSLL